MAAHDAIIFDLDGTLCEYRIAPYDAFYSALEASDCAEMLTSHPDIFNADNFKAQIKSVWNESTERAKQGEINLFPYGASTEGVRRLLIQAGIDDETELASHQKTYLKRMVEHLHFCDGAEHVVLTLKKQYKVGLITNGPSELQWGKINHLGIKEWFDGIIVSDDIGIRKPDPEIYHRLLKELDVSADAAAYVGDTLQYDMLGAHNAGLTSVWVNRNKTYDPEFPKPDHEIKRLEELLKFFSEQ